MKRLSQLVIVTCLLIVASVSADDTLFETEVQPILQNRCYGCHSHSASTLEGGLALDWKSGWEKGGDSGPAIVPGKPDESLLIEAVRRQSFEMPPDEPLPESEVATLVKWIEQGTLDPRVAEPEVNRPSSDWWSLRPLHRPDVPASQSATNAIDAFIDAKLHEAGLERSQPADRATLARRLYYDVHGLPPTPEQVDKFVSDQRSDAVELLVDELLASPRSGERWARHWLDVVHYADTHGFEHDIFRPNAWRYRDYVIQALNNDISWTDFIRQQLAVDVFFPDRTDLIPALGFLGAGPFDLSTAITAPVTFEYMDRDDQVMQTMAAFVSTTANCARCHDHKFDPVSQEDYYSLQAVFAGIGKGDLEFDEDPAVHQTRMKWKSLQAAVAQSQNDILLNDESQQLVTAWEAERTGSSTTWHDLHIEEFVSTDGADLEKLEDGTIRATGARPDVDTYSFTATSDLAQITAIRLDVLTDESLPMHGPGRNDNGNLHLNEFEVQVFEPNAPKPRRLTIKHATADFNQEGWTIAHAIDNDLKTAWGIYPSVGVAHHAVFELSEPVKLTSSTRLVFLLKQRLGGRHLIGRCKLTVTDAPPAQARALPADVSPVFAVPRSERTIDQQLVISKHALQVIADAQLANLPAAAKVYAVSTTLERGTEKGQPLPVRKVHLLSRGSIDKPMSLATPGALSAVAVPSVSFGLSAESEERARRAALANWIAAPDNPLTWRSITNRVWQFHFGQGLCDTPSDFGRMGGTPSHPELLDWLACELRDNGGLLKHLHRLILNSQTYQQSSAFREDSSEIDQNNRLFWRANRQRLDAEQFFDSILQVSGRIDLTMGGPGIQHFTLSPGQQETPKVHYDRYDWTREDARRRAIYRVVWRGIPEPLFEALDFPDLGLLAPQRAESVSALQSLTLWNHPFVLHHCEVTAYQIAEHSSDPDEHVRELFRVVLLRAPTESEFAQLSEYSNQFGLAAAVRLLLNSNEFLFVN